MMAKALLLLLIVGCAIAAAAAEEDLRLRLTDDQLPSSLDEVCHFLK
jgi:hypothetical protein